jgi:hypothetical protein
MLAAPEGPADVNRPHVAWVAAALLVSSLTMGAAPAVRLTFKDGLIWLSANDATAAQILAEWSRVGGTTIVNAERISGPPLKLELNGVLEMEALEILLRPAGGFIAAARVSPPSRDVSQLSGVEQITLLPANARPMIPAPPAGTAPPPEVIAPPPPVFDASGAQRVIGPDGQPVPDDQEGAPPPSSPPAPTR